MDMLTEILQELDGLNLRSHLKDMNKNRINEQIKDLPEDYIEFMTEYNGGVGFIASSYIDLWSIENIGQLNPYFPEDNFSKQVIIIGTNGSGTLYGYDLLEKIFFETDEYEMEREQVKKSGANFLELIRRIKNR